MQSNLVVNAWVGMHDGCVTVTGNDDPSFEFYFQREALARFVEGGGEALAAMTRLAAIEATESTEAAVTG
jgi:hypothetical protein